MTPEEPELTGADVVQVLAMEMAGGLEADHVFVLGLRTSLRSVGHARLRAGARCAAPRAAARR